MRFAQINFNWKYSLIMTREGKNNQNNPNPLALYPGNYFPALISSTPLCAVGQSQVMSPGEWLLIAIPPASWKSNRQRHVIGTVTPSSATDAAVSREVSVRLLSQVPPATTTTIHILLRCLFPQIWVAWYTSLSFIVLWRVFCAHVSWYVGVIY